jgi:hypothetical protein
MISAAAFGSRKQVRVQKKNTYETRLGVYRRHPSKNSHPSSETHELVEHTNAERGDGHRELVPRVIGISIPRSSDGGNRYLPSLYRGSTINRALSSHA